ncbi:MAG TPA: enoyl-CoA hydratase-related protein [Candidatus Limnocylindrales bacterium]|nr:enoyl-CoA hydratase-related protein [Candidatus Limnocylindrales bacterium]
MAGEGPVISERQAAVLRLRLNRPESLNAISGEMLVALRAAFEAAARDDAVRAVVLSGEGRAFSSGGDVKEMAQRYEARGAELGDELRQYYAPVIRAIRRCPKPVIAAINGTAAGAGLSLAMACDLRIAADDARLLVAFVRIGLVPDAGALFFLTRLVGFGKAMELALSGEAIQAGEAQRIGLVNAVAPAHDLDATAMRWAQGFAEGPRQAYGLTKRGLERALSLDLEQALELEAHLQTLAARSPDHREAISAFVAKRKPRFGGTD